MAMESKTSASRVAACARDGNDSSSDSQSTTDEDAPFCFRGMEIRRNTKNSAACLNITVKGNEENQGVGDQSAEGRGSPINCINQNNDTRANNDLEGVNCADPNQTWDLCGMTSNRCNAWRYK